jgi:alpha-D-ribose 1-methylphosphonate 5-triphosphate synthase subunit PhnL
LVEAAKSSDNFGGIRNIGKALDLVVATFSTVVALLRVAIDYVGKFFSAIGAIAQLVAKGDFAGLKASR